MICEQLDRFRHTGNRAETDRLIAWLLDRSFWFEVQIADEFEEGQPQWEVVCGTAEIMK
jgi:hypothetical protein